jgi:hypothetical protein
LYFVQLGVYYRDKKVVGVFVRFRAPLHGGIFPLARDCWTGMSHVCPLVLSCVLGEFPQIEAERIAIVLGGTRLTTSERSGGCTDLSLHLIEETLNGDIATGGVLVFSIRLCADECLAQITTRPRLRATCHRHGG